VTVHLLDVNVLVALLWPAHVGHLRAQNWFAQDSRGTWATCPFTQAAVVRILSNPAFSSDALTMEQAVSLLDRNLKHPAHRLWTDDISFIEAVSPFQKRLVGHQQVTDAYLLGLVIHRKGRLVTMDRTVSSLLPANERSNFVAII